MNVQHFRAFLWLRWRLRINQLRRGGIANTVILILLTILITCLGILLFIGLFFVGMYGMKEARSWIILIIWDAIIVGFLFFWAVGLLADIQRADPLSLDKFLHLPVSPTGVFIVNYLSSLVNLTLILFLSAAVGLSLGMVVGLGPSLLVLFPLLASFVLAVSSLTYQFQGWLASLMTNPRRRRTIVVAATALFILSCQLPNLLNMMQPWHKRFDSGAAGFREEHEELQRKFRDKEITGEQFRDQLEALQHSQATRLKEKNLETQRQFEFAGRIGNVVLPPGWLALAAEGAAEGNLLPALLATVGFSLVGGASLWRAYRTTLRLYTGQFTAGAPTHPAVAIAAPVVRTEVDPKTNRLMEKRLPWVSEQATAIALGGFISLMRAPEAKMMLLGPLVFGLIFGSMLLSRSSDIPVEVRPLTAFGGMGMVLLSMLQMAGNQFGFDRAGFRVFVLCPAPRREILLGKNLAFAPLPMAWGVLLLTILQALFPMRIDHLLACLVSFASMFLLFCLLTNFLSILAPIPVASGSFKPTNTRLVPMLLHLVFFFLNPLVLSFALVPYGVEAVSEWLGWTRGIPLHLPLAVIEFFLVLGLYWLVLGVQGEVLQTREQKILKVVTSKD